MADSGRIAQEIVEVVADESTEKGRVAQEIAEVVGTESTELGRVAQEGYEVAATEGTELGRVFQEGVEVTAKDTAQVRCCAIFAEVFCVPRVIEPYVPTDTRSRTNLFSRPVLSRTRKR